MCPENRLMLVPHNTACRGQPESAAASRREVSNVDILKIVLAIFLPPVAAFLQVNLSTHFWINIVLTLLGGIPGIVHALWLVLTGRSG